MRQVLGCPDAHPYTLKSELTQILSLIDEPSSRVHDSWHDHEENKKMCHINQIRQGLPFESIDLILVINFWCVTMYLNVEYMVVTRVSDYALKWQIN